MKNLSQLWSERAVVMEGWSERGHVASFEDGGRAMSQELSPLKAGKDQEMDIPLELPERNVALPTP